MNNQLSPTKAQLPAWLQGVVQLAPGHGNGWSEMPLRGCILTGLRIGRERDWQILRGALPVGLLDKQIIQRLVLKFKC
jgi:hypothetical protein